MEQFKHFESYLSGKLSNAEKEAFDKRLLDEPDFKSDFEMHKNMQSAMDILVEEDAMQFISILDASPKTSETKVKRKGKRFFILIGLVLLLASIFLLCNPFSQTEESYMHAYLPPLSESTRSTIGKENETHYYSKTQEAHKLISNKKYKKAAKILEGLLNEFRGNEKQEIEWYLALVYSTFDKERSRLLLYRIATEEGHPYARKAKGVLD